MDKFGSRYRQLWIGVDTNWVGVWTALDWGRYKLGWGMDSLGRGIDSFVLPYVQVLVHI